MITDSLDMSRNKRQGRSAVSNGTRMLEGVDGRSPSARRFRDLVNAYASDMGIEFGSMSESQRSTLRQAAGVQLQCETMQSAIVNGKAVDIEQLVRVSNLLVRLLKALGIGPSAGPVEEPEPDLDEYLRGRAA